MRNKRNSSKILPNIIKSSKYAKIRKIQFHISILRVTYFEMYLCITLKRSGMGMQIL